MEKNVSSATNFNDFSPKENALNNIVIRCGDLYSFNILDFLNLPNSQLSLEEERIQIVLRTLYYLNDKAFIYKKFSQLDTPLTIETCCYDSNDNSGAMYLPDTNCIIYTNECLWSNDFIKILAHELKHAEQKYDESQLNNYQKHQIGFLEEAQARVCARYVELLLNNHLQTDLVFDDFLQTKKELRILENKNCKLYKQYKDTYDIENPICGNEIGLSTIPVSFGFSSKQEKEILSYLNLYVSRKPRISKEMISLYRMIEQHTDSDLDYFQRLVKEKDANGEFIIPYDFFTEIYPGLKTREERLYLIHALQSTDRMPKEGFSFELIYMDGSIKEKGFFALDGSEKYVGNFETHGMDGSWKKWILSPDGSGKIIVFELHKSDGSWTKHTYVQADGSEKRIDYEDHDANGCWFVGQYLSDDSRQKDGLWRRFDKDNNLIEERVYSHGKIVSLSRKSKESTNSLLEKSNLKNVCKHEINPAIVNYQKKKDYEI